jgi:hypothetical protein
MTYRRNFLHRVRMTNHCHIVVETPEGNLSQGMRPFNGVYMRRVMRNTGIRAPSCVLFKAPEAEASA